MAVVRLLPLARYVQMALEHATYTRDEDGVVVAEVPARPGSTRRGVRWRMRGHNSRK